MRILACFILLALSTVAGQAQLVKTLHQVFEVPDNTTALSFITYEEDGLEVVPWAGNTIMVESNIKMYYASKAVFDFFLDKGRYNFEAAEEGDTLQLVAQDVERLAIRSGDTQALEKINIRIFIPDEFSQAGPTFWTRPEKEEEEGEKVGAYQPRKKLARERAGVSDELKEAVAPEQPQADSLLEKPAIPLPDSTGKYPLPESTEKREGGNKLPW